jgi:medium-chain acyl-[acyl-carrier-protein] hydrolase
LFASGHRAPQLPNPDRPIHGLADEDFIHAIREFNGTPEAIFESSELLAVLLPMLRADMTAAETYGYRYEAPLNCPVTAFGGLADKLTDSAGIELWAEQTTRAFRIHWLQGGHFFIDHARSEFLSLLRVELEEVLGEL